MPFELEKLSIVMRDDQGSLWTTTFQFDIYFSSKKNTCWAWVGKINGSSSLTIMY
jgi:hypothetical protein